MLKFQFQSGAIKRTETYRLLLAKRCFNSNLVRLKAGTLVKDSRRFCMFQFQSGAIKSVPHGVINKSDISFQFQSGAIKSFPSSG